MALDFISDRMPLADETLGVPGQYGCEDDEVGRDEEVLQTAELRPAELPTSSAG
jgi:hypothetical protein